MLVLPVLCLAGVELHARCKAETNYECGVQVGTQMRAVIRPALLGDAQLTALAAWTRTNAKGRGAYSELYSRHNATYPHLVSEVEGLARGAGLPFALAFVANVRAELSALNETAWVARESACTDYHGPSRTVWGHNEDGTPAGLAASYMVTAEIGAARYTAFTYAGCLSGWCLLARVEPGAPSRWRLLRPLRRPL